MDKEVRTCQNCKKSFGVEPDDFAFYGKIKVPPPTWCPECRMMRRFIFFKERFLFRRKDDASGKEIIAAFPQASPVKVYNHDYWWSDAWDLMEYGRDYDFSRPFFEQFRELLYAVPLPSKDVVRVVNSDYCDLASDLKNVYLAFDAGPAENSAYLVRADYIKDSFDLFEAGNNELCYDSLLAEENYRLFFSMDCESCSDVWFSKDLVGCSNCIGCVGLRKKSYHIFNKPYPKEEYFEKLKEFNLGSYRSVEDLYKKAISFWLNFPVKYMHGWQNVNSSGEHIQTSKNVKDSYCIHNGEDLKNVQINFSDTKDSQDALSFGTLAANAYEVVTCGIGAYNIRFLWACWQDIFDMEYSAFCRSSNNLFGCVGLKKKSYCIFNKQYSEEDYEKLRGKIIRHMDEMPYVDKRGRVYKYGEFFPPEFSPFAYNETIANDFFPLTKEEAEARGYIWRDSDAKEYETTIDAQNLPDHINDVDETVLKEIIKCSSCSKAYRIIQMELDFYRKIGLPLPRLCSNCRYLRRARLANVPKFWHRKCQCAGKASDQQPATGYQHQNQAVHFHVEDRCPNEFETSYAPERPEIVYCEVCYQNEIV